MAHVVGQRHLGVHVVAGHLIHQRRRPALGDHAQSANGRLQLAAGVDDGLLLLLLRMCHLLRHLRQLLLQLLLRGLLRLLLLLVLRGLLLLLLLLWHPQLAVGLRLGHDPAHLAGGAVRAGVDLVLLLLLLVHPLAVVVGHAVVGREARVGHVALVIRVLAVVVHLLGVQVGDPVARVVPMVHVRPHVRVGEVRGHALAVVCTHRHRGSLLSVS